MKSMFKGEDEGVQKSNTASVNSPGPGSYNPGHKQQILTVLPV